MSSLVQGSTFASFSRTQNFSAPRRRQPTSNRRVAMPRHLVTGAVFAVIVFGLTLSVSAQRDPLLGTWKLNLTKSNSNGSGPSSVRKYEPFERDGIKLTIDTTNADGTHTTGGYSGHFDGKDYPVQGSNADAVSLQRLDAFTFEATLKRRGKVVNVVHHVLSKDGRTLTTTVSGSNTAVVWDKQ